MVLGRAAWFARGLGVVQAVLRHPRRTVPVFFLYKKADGSWWCSPG